MRKVKFVVVLVMVVALLASIPAAMGHGYLDVKPGSCPNSVNLGSNGVLPVALAGSADLDVTDIDLATVQLRFYILGDGWVNVTPVRSSIEDVITSYPPDNEPDFCCETSGPDGFMDLSLKFNVQDLATQGFEGSEQPYRVDLIFNLTDGTPLESSFDCIRLVPPNDNGPNGPQMATANGNGNGKLKIK